MADAPEPTAPEPSDPPAGGPAEQDQALAAELAAWKEKALRARADYDNLSRRG
jgi:molecular chaperone GrpE (heat shock protein)